MTAPNEIVTRSNFLSLLRLLLAIPFWFLLDNLQSPDIKYFTFGLALFAVGTDFLDGYLARKRNEITEFGKIIDPVADKIIVGIVVIKLFLIGEIPIYYLLMILGRDILILLGGIFVSRKIGKVLPSNMLGKITVSSIAIVILLIILQINRENIIFLFFYVLSILLIFISLIGYSIRAKEFIKQKNYGSV